MGKTPSERYNVGDTIIHYGMPYFPMNIDEVGECETDYTRPVEHASYRIVDPEGEEDWVCAYDVRRIRVAGDNE